MFFCSLSKKAGRRSTIMNLKYCNCIALAVIVVMAFNPIVLWAQNDHNSIDSIKASVQLLSSDTDKVITLLDRVKGFDCDDSVKKLLLCTEAKRISENIKWNNGLVRTNRVTGLVYFYCQKNYDKAFHYFEENVILAKKNGDKVGQAVALETIGKMYGIIQQHPKSILYYDEALGLHAGINTDVYMLGNKGLSYKAISAYSEALTCYDSALKLLDAKFRGKTGSDQEDSVEWAALSLNMGDLYLLTANADRAFEKFNLVLNSSMVKVERKFRIWGLTGIGKAFDMKKDYQHAIEKYQLALSVCRETNNFEDEVNVKDELAKIYLETWSLNEAQSYADSALSLAESQHFISRLSTAYLIIGTVYLKQNKYDLAETYLLKGLEIAKQVGNLEDQRDAWDALRKTYTLNGKLAEAIKAQDNYYTIRDSLYNVDRVNEFTTRTVRFEAAHTHVTDSLKAENLKKQVEKQRYVTYGGFTALVLVLLLVFFVYRNYVTQKKYNELLSREKKRHLAHIEAQSNILSDIAHTQAHQIRGPISTILGLVHIFNYEDPADPMNKQVMEWITTTTEKLDAVVKDVIIKENTLRSEHDPHEEQKGA